MSDEEKSIPQVMVSSDDLKDIIAKLDDAEEKVDFTVGEYSPRFGHHTGRDVCILFGLLIGLLMLVVVMKFNLLTLIAAIL